MYWHPCDYLAADPTIVEHEGRFHLFFESTTAQPVAGEARGPLSICHYVSDDMERWTELPRALRVGPGGAWDGYLLYHLDVLVTGGMWWMFYTGLDRAGNGQRQQIGIAQSKDGITWEKHKGNPVLTNARYERAIPREGSHRAGDKDLGREWFRDPMVVFDGKSQRWVMAVVARNPAMPVDARACVAGYSSADLVHWRDEGPIYSPGRFHTVETPSIFEHGGKHYLVYMSSPSWGVPIFGCDPWQNAGNYVAVSDQGPLGPYVALEDEMLIASAGAMRLGAQRVLPVSDGRLMLYGWMATRPTPDDGPGDGTRATVFPTLKPVKVVKDHLRVEQSQELAAKVRQAVDARAMKEAMRAEAVETSNQGLGVKAYTGRGAALFDAGSADVLLEAHVRFGQGERAGLAFRCDAQGRSGLMAVLDRRAKRVELSALGIGHTVAENGSDAAGGLPVDSPTFTGAGATGAFIDARAWKVKKEAHVMVACQGVMIEVYVDGRLMIQQARHRERGVFMGVVVERASAVFEGMAHADLASG